MPERLAVLVAEFVNCGESVADAHTLRLGVPLTLGEGVCDLDRVPDTVPERLTVELTLTVPDTDGQPHNGNPLGVWAVNTRLDFDNSL